MVFKTPSACRAYTLTSFCLFSLSWLRSDLAPLNVHSGTQTANQILAEPELLVIRYESGHLRIDKLFAKQLVRRHVGQGTQFLDSKL